MKQSEVEVGGFYHARVSETIQVIRVDAVYRPGDGRRHASWTATNVRTGRKINVTAARLRDRIERRGYEYSSIFGHCATDAKGNYTSAYQYDYLLGKWVGTGGSSIKVAQESIDQEAQA